MNNGIFALTWNGVGFDSALAIAVAPTASFPLSFTLDLASFASGPVSAPFFESFFSFFGFFSLAGFGGFGAGGLPLQQLLSAMHAHKLIKNTLKYTGKTSSLASTIQFC